MGQLSQYKIYTYILYMLIRFKTPNMVERNAKNFCKRKMVFGKVLFRKLLIYYFAHLNILSVPQDLHSHACTSSYTHIYTHRHGFTHTFKYGAHLPDKLAWTLKNLSPDFGPLTPPFPLPVLWSFAPCDLCRVLLARWLQPRYKLI